MNITKRKLMRLIREELSLLIESQYPHSVLISAAKEQEAEMLAAGEDIDEVDEEYINKITSLARHEDQGFRDMADDVARNLRYPGDSYSRDLFLYDFEQKYRSEFERMSDDDVIITLMRNGDIKVWNYIGDFFKQTDNLGFENLVAQWSMKNLNATVEDLYKTGGANNKQHTDAFFEMMDRVFSTAMAIYLTVDDIESLGLQDIVAKYQDKTELRQYQ